MRQWYVTQHKKRQKKQSAKSIKGQNGMLRYFKTDARKQMKIETERQMKITTKEKVKEPKQIMKEKICRKGIDKWQEEMDILKSDISQIKEYIKTMKNNKE